jgi:hypothetical protein
LAGLRLPASPPTLVTTWLDGRTGRFFMSTHIYVDETKAKGYLVAAVTGVEKQLILSRKQLGHLILPGQRSLHMRDEKDSRKREIADTIVGLAELGVRATIYDAGRAQTERERRGRCLRALLDDAAHHASARIVFDLDETLLGWDRQMMVELTRSGNLRERVTYTHATRHQELLLAIPDGIAWCWAKGGHWRQRVRPIIDAVREV